MTRIEATTAVSARSPLELIAEYETFTPFLASFVFHLSLTLVLGLMIQAAAPQTGFDIEFSSGGDLGAYDFDAGGGGDPFGGELETPSTEPPPVAAAAAASEVAAAEASLDGVFADDAALNELAIDPAALLAVSGSSIVGDGGSGPGSGGGHGAGRGDGIGDGKGSGRAITSMFGLAGEGGDFVYVFDRSDSMNYVYSLRGEDDVSFDVTPLEAAKNELTRSLGDLKEDCRFQVVFYNDSAVTFDNVSFLFPATRANIARVREFIRDMVAEAGTNHLSGLEQAIAAQPQVIFLLTDAEEKDDPAMDVIRRLTVACKRAKIKVNVIHFCSQARSRSTLRELARATRGQHKFITLHELAQAKLRASRRSNKRSYEFLMPSPKTTDAPPQLRAAQAAFSAA